MKSTSAIHENSLVRLLSIMAGISLLAAAGVLIFGAFTVAEPLLQGPAVIATIIISILTVRGGSKFVDGHSTKALCYWGSSFFVLILMPSLQMLPIEYNSIALLNVRALAPPFWQYVIAVPIVGFLFMNTLIPTIGPNRTSNFLSLLGLFAVMNFLFFYTVLIADVANKSNLMFIPEKMSFLFFTPIIVSVMALLSVVLLRKGLHAVGIFLLISIGLGIELVSTWSYDGPHFLAESRYISYDYYPLLPILAGTLTGILLSVIAVVAMWQLYSSRLLVYSYSEADQDRV